MSVIKAALDLVEHPSTYTLELMYEGKSLNKDEIVAKTSMLCTVCLEDLYD